MTSPILSTVTDGVRTITLNEAPGNAINGPMMAKLLEILQIANHDWETRVIVLESAVPGVFSIGEDFEENKPTEPNEPYDSFGVPNTGMAFVRHAMRGIWDAKWPVIAKINGTAAGDGLLWAALCDMAVVSETAKVGLPDARHGSVSSVSILRRCMSEQAARYLLWSARLFEANELRALGTGMLIVPEVELDTTVNNLAQEIKKHDPHVLRHLKVALNEAEGSDALDGHAAMQRYTALLQAKKNSPV